MSERITVPVRASSSLSKGHLSLAVDGWAAGLSLICLVHCLALPLLATSLPVLGLWSDSVWVHVGLLGLALPTSGWAFWRGWQRHGHRWPGLLGGAGLALLSLGIALHAQGDAERWLTVSGALALVIAHVGNVRLPAAD